MSFDLVVFSIEVNEITLLLKFWMNCQEKLAKSRETEVSQIDLHLGQSFMTLIVLILMLIPLKDTMYFRKQISS